LPARAVSAGRDPRPSTGCAPTVNSGLVNSADNWQVPTGRSLVAQFLVGLTDAATTTGEPPGDPGLAEILHECAVGLIRQRLGQPDGITPHTRRLLQQAHIRSIIRQHLANPQLDPDRIATAANISPRYLHTIFQDTDFTPMQLLKRLRLEECRRSLQDPAQARTPIKDIIAAHGYRRPDQFARDFKQQFGISANQVRNLASPPDDRSQLAEECQNLLYEPLPPLRPRERMRGVRDSHVSNLRASTQINVDHAMWDDLVGARLQY
jgi:AraC-like DNA-binding protein